MRESYRRGSLVVLLVAAAFAVALAAGARADSKPVLISSDCASSHYKPSEILIACADARLRFEASGWTRWDSTGAKAIGEFIYADCAPNVPLANCHHDSRDEATVKLYRPRFCPTKGRRFFTRLRLSDPDNPNPYLRGVQLKYKCGYVS